MPALIGVLSNGRTLAFEARDEGPTPSPRTAHVTMGSTASCNLARPGFESLHVLYASVHGTEARLLSDATLGFESLRWHHAAAHG